MRTKVHLLSFLLVLASGCQRRSDPFRENYLRVQKGMTLQEVEAILGKGEKMANAPEIFDHVKGGSRPVVEGDMIYRWAEDAGPAPRTVVIGFKENRVHQHWWWEPDL